MNEEKEENKNGEVPKEFGNVIDALHQKRKLSSLRTYQGDVAEFIKEKNESTISIALKEKEREEKIQKELYINPRSENQNKSSSGLAIFFGSLILIIFGVFAFYYAFQYVKKDPVVPVIVEESIIPYKSNVSLSISGPDIAQKISRFSLSATEGVTIFKISDQNGKIINRSKDLFYISEIDIPNNLERIIKDNYVLGVYNDGKKTSPFLIVSIDDFTRGFAAMLEWEKRIPLDLSFLENGENWNFVESKNQSLDFKQNVATSSVSATSTATTSSIVATSSNIFASTTISTSTNISTSTKENIATTTKKISENGATTTSTTTIIVTPPMKPEVWSWKDLIVKNKDTRALVNDKEEVKISYTFLDKNTILITNSLSTIGDLSIIYTSKSVAR